MNDRKYFTLDEANRTLPLVRRVVGDIVEAYGGLQGRVQEYNRLTEEADTAEAAARAEALRAALEDEAAQIDAFVAELAQIGCQLKGFEDGLVDFHAQYRERTILLCWKLGEPQIEWWHELDGGFAGRQPITEEMAEELTGSAAR